MDPQKKEALIKSIWNAFLKILEDIAIKKALAFFLKSAASGGFKAWLVRFLVEEGFEEFAVPTANALLVDFRYQIDLKDGKKYLVRLKGANNEADWDHVIDDINN